jgi:DNA-directed RNA polymerase subunit K/omega
MSKTLRKPTDVSIGMSAGINPATVDVNIKPIDLVQLNQISGNVYKAVAILGKRAAQIAKSLKAELNEKLSQFGPVGDSLDEFTTENREQTEIARHYESLPEPTLLALHEFLRGKTVFKDPDPLQ